MKTKTRQVTLALTDQRPIPTTTLAQGLVAGKLWAVSTYKYMKRIISVIVVIVLVSSMKGYSQNLFPEKFSGCNTDQFALESDSVTARMDHSELISVITSGFSQDVKNQLKGVLSLQIIVDLEGKSCLISVKNDTNTKTKKLKLKETIDSKLLWQKPAKKVATVIAIKFDSTAIQIKRLGTNAKKGVHELKE